MIDFLTEWLFWRWYRLIRRWLGYPDRVGWYCETGGGIICNSKLLDRPIKSEEGSF